MPSFNTNAGTDLAAAGSDFASLILGVGNAVAATQVQLTQTSVDSTSALASTIVDVIAVQETTFDDNGNVSSSQAFTQRLPLIDFIDPVFYQWTQVRLQGRFFVSELATQTTSTSGSTSVTDSTQQHGLLLLFGGGQTLTDGKFSSSSTSTDTDSAQAVGLARMYAQLNPRTNIGVPKPTQVIQGPSLNVVQGQLTELPGGGAPPTSRSLSLLLQLRRMDGTPIPNKAISIETDGTPWAFTNPAQTTTDANGNLSVTLQRSFVQLPPPAPPPDTAAAATIVTVRMGLVTNSVTVTF